MNPTPVYAGFGLRATAYIVDFAVIGALYLVLSSLLIPPAFLLAQAALGSQKGSFLPLIVLFLVPLIIMPLTYFAYFTFFIGKHGQTVGQMLAKITVVDATGKPIGYARAFVRTLVLFIVTSFPLIFLHLLIVFDQKKQGVHDKILGTYVVRQVNKSEP